jgi:hypothetical protein
MDFEVLPGPSLPELARTALARAAAATVSHASPPSSLPAAIQVPVRASRDGSPVLLAHVGSVLDRRLAAFPEAVTVSVPAGVPYSALRLAGAARPAARDRTAGITAHALAVRSVEFAGAIPARIPLAQYRAAAPDPLWREAPGVLTHLEHRHMTELIDCVRAHGMPQADWVIPRGLDRYGLQLLVLAPSGVAMARLSFPDGPVTSLRDVPASIRTALTCRCQSATGHHNGHAPSA